MFSNGAKSLNVSVVAFSFNEFRRVDLVALRAILSAFRRILAMVRLSTLTMLTALLMGKLLILSYLELFKYFHRVFCNFSNVIYDAVIYNPDINFTN